MHSTFTVPCKEFNLVSFASSIMRNILVFAFSCRAKFPVKLISCIALDHR